MSSTSQRHGDDRGSAMTRMIGLVGSNRRRIERVGLAFTALLSISMVGFILLYWTRDLPLTGPVYRSIMNGGALLDQILGTNVFKHPFMWQSIATGVLIGVVAPLVGTFVVHREMALIGETLAHTAFAGVAIGILFAGLTGWDGSLLLVALGVGVLGALGVQWLRARTSTYGDVPIAIVLSGSFAIGTLLISWGRDIVAVGVDIEGLLFGSIAVVTVEGARLMAVITLAVVAVVVMTYKQLLFITFDEQAARVAQFDVRGYNTLLIVMTAVVVVGALQVLGVILVAAMLVVPVAAATQIANSFRETVYLSVLFGQLAVLGGFAISIMQGLPAGGSIVIVAIAVYLVSVVVSNRSTAMSYH